MKRTTGFLVSGAIAAALALGGLVGGVLAESPSAGPAVTAPRAFAERALSVAAGGVSAATVAELEQEVRARPGDSDVLAQLGFAYQLRWRETGDPSFLPRSDSALRQALRSRPGDASAVLGLGSLALIQHEFREALSYGRQAQRLLPGSARPLGVIGDALVELGRYPEAFAAFERMAALRPNLASYARIAYARELTGDLEGAAAAMDLALDTAGGQPEPAAWSLVELAKLEVRLGRVELARRHVRAALRILPGYPAASVELARIEAARGRLRAALVAAKRAADAVPTETAVGLFSELLDRTGRTREAQRQRAVVRLTERLLRASGVQVDLEAAVFRADHRIAPLETVSLARRARSARSSIYGDDALAWALARAGRCAEAVPLATRALRLGTQDPLLYFHLGYAQGCAGDHAGMRVSYGRALGLDPAFSIRWAPVARATLGAG